MQVYSFDYLRFDDANIVKMQHYIRFFLLLILSQMAFAMDSHSDDIWKQITEEIDKQHAEQWKRSSELDRDEWAKWFAEQSHKIENVEDAEEVEEEEADIFSTLRKHRPPLTRRTTTPFSGVSRTDSTGSRPGRRKRERSTDDRPHAYVGFMSQSDSLNEQSPLTDEAKVLSATKEEKYDPHQILPTFSEIQLLSPSIFEPTDYFSLPKHSDINSEVTPQESPHRYISNLFTTPNARSPFERSLSRRGRPTRNRSAKETSRSRTSEQRQHVCELCGDVFFREEHCKRHVRTVHSNAKPFECHVCHIRMSREDNLQAHLRSVHEL